MLNYKKIETLELRLEQIKDTKKTKDELNLASRYTSYQKDHVEGS